MDDDRRRRINGQRRLSINNRSNQRYNYSRFPLPTLHYNFLTALGGENIIPLEIENILFSHPAILQASVVAIADEKYGEVVGAFIERDPHVYHFPPVTREEVKSFVAKRLSRYKVPRYVFFLGEDGIQGTWPVTASGKIRKVELRSWGDKAV